MKTSLFYMVTLLCTGMSYNIYAHQEVDIDLSEVPADLIQAAENARPGIKLTEAERIIDNGKVSYELEGNLNREQFEFEITAQGKLIEMELEND